MYGLGVGDAEGFGVGLGLGLGVGLAVGFGLGLAVGAGVGVGAAILTAGLAANVTCIAPEASRRVRPWDSSAHVVDACSR
jgi:hypothetical protein